MVRLNSATEGVFMEKRSPHIDCDDTGVAHHGYSYGISKPTNQYVNVQFLISAVIDFYIFDGAYD